MQACTLMYTVHLHVHCTLYTLRLLINIISPINFYYIINYLKGARGKCFFFWENKFSIFLPLTRGATHECPQKISVQSVQPFGRLYTQHINIRMSCFIISCISVLCCVYVSLCVIHDVFTCIIHVIMMYVLYIYSPILY